MKFNKDSDITAESPLNITDTENLSANRLLALFLSECSPLNELMDKNETIKSLYIMTETWKNEGKNWDVSETVATLPYEICRCFLIFLANSKHIHVTID